MLPDEGGHNDNLASQKLMNKLNNILADFKNIQSKEKEVNKEAIKAEVDSLPERSLIELSLAKAKLTEETKKAQEELDKKEESIKSLELQLIAKRDEIERKKQEEQRNLELIQSLQQQVAVLRSKTFGYDISKKYEYYKDKSTKGGPAGKIEDENLAFAMWEKENYDNRRSNLNPSLGQLENSKDMWISGSNKTGKVVRDVDLANSYNNVNAIKSTNNYNNYNNYNANVKKSTNQGRNQGIGTNMRKYTPMIFDNK